MIVRCPIFRLVLVSLKENGTGWVPAVFRETHHELFTSQHVQISR